MARLIRILYEDAVCHVTARGNQQRRTFHDDSDRELFLETLGQCVALHGIKVHGYGLMPSHYHLLPETPRGNLSRALGWLADDLYHALQPSAAALRALVSRRFKSQLVDVDPFRYAEAGA